MGSAMGMSGSWIHNIGFGVLTAEGGSGRVAGGRG